MALAPAGQRDKAALAFTRRRESRKPPLAQTIFLGAMGDGDEDGVDVLDTLATLYPVRGWGRDQPSILQREGETRRRTAHRVSRLG